MTEARDDDGRVTLAVLRNDLAHLAAAVELLRGDFRDFIAVFQSWRKEHEEDAQKHELRIDRLEGWKRVASWVFLAIWGILAVVIASAIKSALGL